MSSQSNPETTLHNDAFPQVSFVDFAKAVPHARALCHRYPEYIDDHSQWLGRWVNKAERSIAQSCLAPDSDKQIVADKLIAKLFMRILVSPFDCSPFEPHTEKRPVLFKGFVFPHWMLEDIFNLIGNPDGMRSAKPHELMNQILEWTKSFKESPQPIPSNCTALISRNVGGALVVSTQMPSQGYLDSGLLVSLNFDAHPELAIIKLLTYRNLINNAFKIRELDRLKKGAKNQSKQIEQFGQEQRIRAEAEKAQMAQARAAHEHAIDQQFKDIAQTQAATQNIVHEHLQSLLDQMSQAEERMRNVKQECQDKEAQIQAYKAAQNSLRH